MLAQALPGIFPDWSYEEAMEATQIHALGSAYIAQSLLTERPFRSPHQTASPAALIGGGELPLPGEISLAHQGILFLDELPEFRRDALEALRQPLEEGRVHLQRVRGKAVYAAQFPLGGYENPCPDAVSACAAICADIRLRAYRSFHRPPCGNSRVSR